VTASTRVTAKSTQVTAKANYRRVFFALVRRDVLVTRGELGTLIAQGLTMPFLLLFIFGKVVTGMGMADESYAQVLYPGMIAMVTMAGALQSSALPLVIDFATGKEIEDRLLAPVPTWLVAVEKIVFAGLRGMFTAALMVPIVVLVLGPQSVTATGVAVAVVTVVIGGLLGAAIGIALGTAVTPRRITMMFALILTPMTFTGGAQYPLLELGQVRWFQVLSALNPMTYFSESIRGALAPEIPHLNPWLSMGVLVACTVLFGAVAVRGFLRRAVA